MTAPLAKFNERLAELIAHEAERLANREAVLAVGGRWASPTQCQCGVWRVRLSGEFADWLWRKFLEEREKCHD